MAYLKRTGHSLTAAIERFEEDGIEGIEVVPFHAYTAPRTTSNQFDQPHSTQATFRLAQAWSIVQEWIRPVPVPLTPAQWPACFGRDSMPLPIPEKVAASVRMLKDPDSAWEIVSGSRPPSAPSTTPRSPSLLPKIYAAHVEQAILLLPALDVEIRAHLSRADQAQKLGRDSVAAAAAAASELEGLAGKLALALKCWATGLKALEGDYVNQFTTTITAFIRASLSTPDEGAAFRRMLTAWLRSRTLPPRYIAPRGLAVPAPAAWKPDLLSGRAGRPVRDLFRLGIFASFSTILTDVAHEEIDRLVRGETIGARAAPGAGVEPDAELDDEDSPYAVRRLAGLERVVTERIVAWLGAFVGECLQGKFHAAFLIWPLVCPSSRHSAGRFCQACKPRVANEVPATDRNL